MAVSLTDTEIAALLAEAKTLPADLRQRFQTRPKRGHRERELDLTGDNGTEFRLILRQSLLNALDFSVILTCLSPQSTSLFRLRRYNGRSHEHTNLLESETFYDFHVHTATERYQLSGLREDAYAERTDLYQDFAGAQQRLILECGFKASPNSQLGFYLEGTP